jgi:molecular chaperone DnaK (HSP70)
MHLFAWPAEPQPDGSSVSEIVGIDFGTTTSSVATSREGVAVLIPNALGQVETPSAVAIDEDGTPLVGEAALMLLLRRPERGVMEVKRLFGRETARAFGGAPVLEVDGTSYRPTDLAAFVFRQLRRDAEAHLGAPVRRVVLAAPAHFDHSQLLALRQAAGLAALEVLRVIPEPVAACLGSGALIDTRRRLVQMCLRLLRGEVWASHGKKRLHRATARIVPDAASTRPPWWPTPASWSWAATASASTRS